MTAFYHTVAIQNAEPSKPMNGLFWMKPVNGNVYIALVGDFLPVASSNAFDFVPQGFYFRQQFKQEAVPGAAVAGDTWLKESIGALYIFIDQFVPLLGG
jgi:hypothetical protein